MLERTWFLFWMLLVSNIHPIGFLLHYFGRPWILLIMQQDIVGGNLFYCEFSLLYQGIVCSVSYLSNRLILL